MRNRSLNTTVGPTGNVGTGEDDLLSYTMPANVMAVDEDYIHIRASGTIANNANAKRVKLKFGGTILVNVALPTSVATDWLILAEVVRTGASAQKANAVLMVGNGTTSPYVQYTALTIDLTAAVIIKCTGEATNNDDIVQQTLTVKGEAYA